MIHRHRYEIVGLAQGVNRWDSPITQVKRLCSKCRRAKSELLLGHWEPEELGMGLAEWSGWEDLP